ncbi:Uncharacterized protein TPAR_03994 [Tolypocladium paradoxum]|uniref:Uncharacterized protein n=1 Tax=Tolypocladium paradoxum TaxID=94208 RepID=A0A2S4L022_9HYPO|nr:Uncharacterized protein TPAR_03994 [Tolypocladium paradoxum]
MAVLAQRLAERYRGFRLVLPPSYVDAAIARWQGEQPRASRFWEKALDEVEKANSAWSVVRLWILLSVIQSTLVACAFSALPAPARVVLLVANALAHVWSTTVMCEMLHARYVDVKADEQELHDLLGGLRG